MTISATTVRTITGLGDGSNTDHTIGFTFQDNDHIEVYVQDESVSPYTLTQLVYGAGAGKYTITGGDPGLTVVMGTALTTTQRALIRRATPNKQTVDYVSTSAFPADDHEEQMDRQVMMEQETTDKLSRALTLWPTSSGFDPTLPATLTAGSALIINATADGMTTGPILADAAAEAAAAAASAAAALASETAAGVSAAAANASAIAAAAVVGGAVVPIFEVLAASSGLRNGVNQVFVLQHTPYPGSKVAATVDGVMVEVLTPLANQVTISAQLAADLANPSLDLKFTYIRTIAASPALNQAYVATAVNYTVLLTDTIIGVTDTSAPRTISLPDNATAGAGFTVHVTDESGGASGNTITIDAAGADTIDGAGSIPITTDYGSHGMYATGTGLWKTF